MLQLLKGLKTNYLISAVLCVLSGMMLVIWPDVSFRVVCMGLGCVLLLSGIVHLAGFFAERDGGLLTRINLLAGIILAVVGIWIVWKPDILMMTVPVVIGAIIVMHGLHNISQAAGLYKEKYDKWWIALLLGIMTALFGLLLIVNPFEAVSTAVRLTGVLLLFDGVSDIWILSRIAGTARALEEKE